MNKKLIVGSVALVVVAIAGYGALVESAKKDATVMGSVGTIAVSITPYPTTVSTDNLAITNNTPGTFNFSGWTVKTDGGSSHTIDAPALEAGKTLHVCGADVSELNCVDMLGTANFFDNNAGTVTLSDIHGSVVSTFSYSAPSEGQTYKDAPDLRTTVYSGNASVEFCRTDNQGGYAAAQATVQSVIGEKAHANPDRESIIPSFYYNLGGGVEFFDGLNWPDMSGVLANGCS